MKSFLKKLLSLVLIFLFIISGQLGVVSPVFAEETAPEFVRKWGSSGSGNSQFKYPWAVAFDSSGNVYVAEDSGHRIQKFDSSGNFLLRWGSNGSGNGQFNYPDGIALDSSGNVYVGDCNNDRIQKFDSSGNFLLKWGSLGSGNGQLYRPYGIAVDSSDNVYVADYSNHRIQKFDSSGNFLTKWGSSGSSNGQFSFPIAVAVDSSDNVYVADRGNNRIQKFDSSGNFLTKWGSSGSSNGQFSNWATGVAVDSSDNVYVADSSNHRIQKFDSSGNFLTKWGSYGSGNGQFKNSEGVSVGPLGNVYVADLLNNRIQVFGSSAAPTGSVSVPGNTKENELGLNISASDSLDTSAYLQMEISNNSDYSESDWESYATSKAWTIPTGEGTKNIYARFRNRNGNIASYVYSLIYDTTSPVSSWINTTNATRNFESKTVGGTIGVSNDNLYTKDELPTFTLTQSLDAVSGIDKYQIVLTKAGEGSNGYVDKVYIDNIPPNKPSDSSTRDEVDRWTNYNGDDVSVRSKRNEDKLASGAYKWKVRAIDKAGNATDTAPKILRINTHEANFSNTYFPLTLLSPDINSKTNTLVIPSAVEGSLSFSLYGITTSGTKVTLRVTDSSGRLVLSRETTANAESRYGINILKTDNLKGAYTALLSATNTNGDYKEIPEFKLVVGGAIPNSILGASTFSSSGKLPKALTPESNNNDSGQARMTITPTPTLAINHTPLTINPPKKHCFLFLCW